jgi:hypothetical protein
MVCSSPISLLITKIEHGPGGPNVDTITSDAEAAVPSTNSPPRSTSRLGAASKVGSSRAWHAAVSFQGFDLRWFDSNGEGRGLGRRFYHGRCCSALGQRRDGHEKAEPRRRRGLMGRTG